MKRYGQDYVNCNYYYDNLEEAKKDLQYYKNKFSNRGIDNLKIKILYNEYNKEYLFSIPGSIAGECESKRRLFKYREEMQKIGIVV